MKYLRMIAMLLICVLLVGCGKTDKVNFYETKAYIQHDTGDINLRENTYDENWNLLKQYTTLNGNFASQVEYEYSEDYTVLTTTSISATYGTEISTVVRTFDEKGQIIKGESYDGDRLVGSREYTYNEDGEMIFVKSNYPDSDVVTTLERIFDDEGNLIRYIQDTGYYVGRYEYSYNHKNQRIREEYYRDDELLDYREYVWEGNVGNGISYNTEGTPIGKLILEYDDFGNLLRLESQKPSGVILTVCCYEYIGTDGSISSGIPN